MEIGKIELYEEIPEAIKLTESIRELLKKRAINQPFQQVLDSCTAKMVETNETHKWKNWEIFMDGTAYKGQVKEKTDLPDGWGRKIDVFGRILHGNFSQGKFKEGIVINRQGGAYATKTGKETLSYLDFRTECYVYLDQTEYIGDIRRGLPNGNGEIQYKTARKILNHDLTYEKIRGVFKDGLPHGRCVIHYTENENTAKFSTEALFQNGKIKRIIKNETKDYIYYHNCTLEECHRHICVGISKFDGSVIFYGDSSLVGQNGNGYTFNIEYIEHNQKFLKHNDHSINATTKKGIEYHKYTSSCSFLETDWRHDEQISVGKQYMKYSGVIVDAEWALSNNQNRIMEIRRVLTKQGGKYTREGPEADQFVFMQIREKMVEKTKQSRFDLVRKDHKYFVTINSAFNASIFSQIQICSGISIKKIDRMISYTISGISEGEASLDHEYYTGEFQGKGFKSQYLLNYTFDGVFVSDEPKQGKLVSSFLKFEGELKDYTLVNGVVQLLFTEGFKFEGFLNSERITGEGILTFPKSANGKAKIIKCEWKNGICQQNRNIAIIHGDKKRKLHRYCLVFLDKKHNTPFSTDDGLEVITKNKAIILTTLIYNRKYKADSLELDLTAMKNLRIRTLNGKLEALSLTLSPFREFEKIANESVNGRKTITECTYHTTKGKWIKKGSFSSKHHIVRFVSMCHKEREIEIEISFTNYHCLAGNLNRLKISPKERHFLNTKLGIKNIEEEAEFRYGIFNELEERIIISRRKDIVDERDEFHLFSGKAVAYHLNGDISYGHFQHNFLNGKGVRLYSGGGSVKRIEGNWVADQTEGIVDAEYTNGAKYVGTMKFLERHGKGKLLFKNGERFDGDWFSGVKHGIGTYFWPCGALYEGRFKLNMMWGWGKLTIETGETVEGRFWKNELKHQKTILNREGPLLEN